jgi:hypothetical protein
MITNSLLRLLALFSNANHFLQGFENQRHFPKKCTFFILGKTVSYFTNRLKMHGSELNKLPSDAFVVAGSM